MAAHAPRTEPPLEQRILGQRVDPLTKAQAINMVLERATLGSRGAYVCLTNVHTTIESRRTPELREAANQAFLSVPDGMPLAWVLRRRGHVETEKITGIEYMPLLATAGLGVGLRHFLYGGAPGVADRAARRLGAIVPGVQVVGATSPPFANLNAWPVDDLQEELRRTRPHVLWVGLGAPKQELWMAEMSKVLEVPLMIGVGAGIDYLAGTKRPAPTILRHVGLEWLFRLAVEPRRLWRRYLLTNTTFVWLLARESLSGSISRQGRRDNKRGGTA